MHRISNYGSPVFYLLTREVLTCAHKNGSSQSQAQISKVMRQDINVEDAFRLWVRTMLEQMLGDEPDNVRYGIFPVKQFTQIAIEEVFLYIGRKQWRAPQKSTADMLEINVSTVSRAIT